jgi:hypothetical protein
MKKGKRRRVAETRFVSEATLADLDLALIGRFGERQVIRASSEGILAHYRLAEGRNGRAVLTMAELLFFGKDPGLGRSGDVEGFRQGQGKAISSRQLIEQP